MTSKSYGELHLDDMSLPSPSQIKKVEPHRPYIRMEMNGWYEEFTIFNPGMFLENAEARAQAMAMFEDTLLAILKAGLEGPAPEKNDG